MQASCSFKISTNVVLLVLLPMSYPVDKECSVLNDDCATSNAESRIIVHRHCCSIKHRNCSASLIDEDL